MVRGTAWFLRDRLSKTPRRHEAQGPARRGPLDGHHPTGPGAARVGTVPAPWSTPAGPTAAACPTASAGVANRNQLASLVKPSLLLDKALPYDPANPALSADPVFQLRTSLLESERYLLGAQYFERWYTRRGQRFTDVLSRFPEPQQEYAVRRPAMAALTTAVAARTRAHSDTVVGRTRDEAIMYADWLVRSIACQHVAVSPGGWGGGWQTAHWATLAGEAAWLIWDRLTPQTREYVAQMIVYEADIRLTQPVEYWADASGTIVSKGNTYAEENSWNAALLELAVSMMPTHPQAKNWRRKAVDLEVSASAAITDINSAIVVNGATLADRLDGANIYDDGTVENHQVIQPDYMTNIQQNWWAADFAGLAGRKVPVGGDAQRGEDLRRVHHGVLPGGRSVTGQRRPVLPAGRNHLPPRQQRHLLPAVDHLGDPAAGALRQLRRARATPTVWTRRRPGRPATRWRSTSRGSRRWWPATAVVTAGPTATTPPPRTRRTTTTAARSTPPPSSRRGGWRCTSAGTPGTGRSTRRPRRGHLRSAADDDPRPDRLVLGAARLEPGRRAAQPVAPPTPAARPSLGPARGRWQPRR